MRRILVDYAPRASRRQTRRRHRAGGPGRRHGGSRLPEQSEELLAVDEAVEKLAALDPQQARVVEMRYFGGLTVEETAAALGHRAPDGEAGMGAGQGLASRGDLVMGPAMSPERWSRLKEIFGTALELPEDQREPFLIDRCGSDLALRAEDREAARGGARAARKPAARRPGRPPACL